MFSDESLFSFDRVIRLLAIKGEFTTTFSPVAKELSVFGTYESYESNRWSHRCAKLLLRVLLILRGLKLPGFTQNQIIIH